jgi:hypothetical protein
MIDLNEEHIFQVYKDIIGIEHTAPFTDFTQENRDTYIRLKFRTLSPPSIPKLQSPIQVPDFLQVNPKNFSNAFAHLEQKLTFVTVKHETLITQIDLKMEDLKTQFITAKCQLNQSNKDFTNKITKYFENALKKIKIAYRRDMSNADMS